MADPLAYYDNNVVKSRSLIQAVVEAGVKKFIFLLHRHRLCRGCAPAAGGRCARAPISPYARSKLMTEWMLEDVQPRP